ncbi:hypothetical protein GCM10010421_17580 [Streptomyces glaucus]|uniref:Secreted protein n=1 Tax=Streptomyces glaucus TaxID=284029 RepID=A0ABP5WPD1_9ACTN
MIGRSGAVLFLFSAAAPRVPPGATRPAPRNGPAGDAGATPPSDGAGRRRARKSSPCAGVRVGKRGVFTRVPVSGAGRAGARTRNPARAPAPPPDRGCNPTARLEWWASPE